MAIKETITQSQFMDAFRCSEFRKDSFSYEGLKVLYNYLWDYSEDIGDIELDVVAIDCDWTEYEDFKHFQEEYKDIGNMDDLRYNTTVLEIPNTSRFIIGNF
jgi:hypothetical protein|tara:strand:- start:188 stop:493 length:306 start_codon:yes stop_codon:yes gene_type:complete